MQKQKSTSSKSELLAFLNKELNCNISRIEQLGTGVLYCRLFEKLHPGSIKNLKPDPKYEWEYLGNLRLLQKALHARKVQKTIDINKLVLCKFNDNFQFMLWLKEYYEEHFKQNKKVKTSVEATNVMTENLNSQTPTVIEIEKPQEQVEQVEQEQAQQPSLLITPQMMVDMKVVTFNKENVCENLNTNIKKIDELIQKIKEEENGIL